MSKPSPACYRTTTWSGYGASLKKRGSLLRAAVLAVSSRVASELGFDRKQTTALDSEIRAAMEAIANDH